MLTNITDVNKPLRALENYNNFTGYNTALHFDPVVYTWILGCSFNLLAGFKSVCVDIRQHIIISVRLA